MSEIEVTGASPDVAAAVASVRASMADLDVAIAALRDEAVRLRASADATGGLLLLERPVDVIDEALGEPVVDVVDRDQAAEAFPEEFGRVVETPTVETEATDIATAVLELEEHTDSAEQVGVVASVEAASTTVDTVEEDVAEDVAEEDDDDQLAAITAAASARATLPWGDEDDAEEKAFDKFFSADVEDEPAQRWLLDDM